MTLFTMLLVIIAERLFKLGEHWHLDHRLEVLFRRIKHFSMLRTLLMMAGVMVMTHWHPDDPAGRIIKIRPAGVWRVRK